VGQVRIRYRIRTAFLAVMFFSSLLFVELGVNTNPAFALATRFADLQSTHPYYAAIEYLVDRGVMSGYSCGKYPAGACNGTNDPYFLPDASVTRGQMAKIIVNAENWTIYTPPGTSYTFADVLRSDQFFQYVETVNYWNIANGYACGGSGEPCDSLSRPYYRPSANISRGQLSKMVTKASHSVRALLNPPTATFADVPLGAPFFQYAETLYAYGIMSGHACGTKPEEPCPGTYFGVGFSATRGELSDAVFRSTLLSPDLDQDPNNTAHSFYPGANNFHCNVTSPSSGTCPSPNTACNNPSSAFLPGQLAGFSSDYGTFNRFKVIGRELSWDTNAKAFLSCQTSNNNWYALVFHARVSNGGCGASGFWATSFRSSLPGSLRTTLRNSCGTTVNDEIRVESNNGSGLITDSVSYFAEVEWATGSRPGEMTIDNYLVANTDAVLHRNYMKSIFYLDGYSGTYSSNTRYNMSTIRP
jgi:hypothetical protein